jgi:hypothetical protein
VSSDVLSAGSERTPLKDRFWRLFARRKPTWWLALVGGAGLAALAFAVTAVVLPARLGHDLAPVLPSPEPLTWPERGDLIGTPFVAAARAQLEPRDTSGPRVLLAQRLSDGGRVLIAVSPGGPGLLAANTVFVPAGRPVEAAQISGFINSYRSHDLLAWAAKGADGHTCIVVLGRPGPLHITLTPWLSAGSGSEPYRRSLPAYSPHGLVVADLGRGVESSVQVRPEQLFGAHSQFLVRIDLQWKYGAPPLAVGGGRDR